jgi:hypothetical protein
VINRYIGNLAPMPGVFPDYPAPVVRNTEGGSELAMMRWGMPPPPRTGGPPVTNIRNTTSPHLERIARRHDEALRPGGGRPCAATLHAIARARMPPSSMSTLATQNNSLTQEIIGKSEITIVIRKLMAEEPLTIENVENVTPMLPGDDVAEE